MATRKVTYASSGAVTCTQASLATSSTLVAGRQSAEVDNTSNLYLDGKITGKWTVGTTPTANTRTEIWGVPKLSDSGYPDTFGASDANVTVTSRAAALGAGAVLIASIDIDVNTSNRTYYWQSSVLKAFGYHPEKFIFFVVHNNGVTSNATGSNFEIDYKGSYETIA